MTSTIQRRTNTQKKNEEKTFLKKDYCWATDLGPSGLLEEIYHLYIIVLRFAR